MVSNSFGIGIWENWNIPQGDVTIGPCIIPTLWFQALLPHNLFHTLGYGLMYWRWVWDFSMWR